MLGIISRKSRLSGTSSGVNIRFKMRVWGSNEPAIHGTYDSMPNWGESFPKCELTGDQRIREQGPNVTVEAGRGHGPELDLQPFAGEFQSETCRCKLRVVDLQTAGLNSTLAD